MSLAGFGATASQLPYRQSMHGSVATVQNAVKQYITDTARSSAIFDTAVKIIHSSGDGNERVNQCIIGAVNYIDYLLNHGGLQPAQALEQGVSVCVNGFISNIVLNNPVANQLDQTIRHQLSQAEQQLSIAINLVNQYITPEIMKERGGGFGTTQLGGGQQRRQENGFGGVSSSAGGMDLMRGNTGGSAFGNNNGSLFTSNAPVSTGQGGGVSLNIEAPVSQQKVIQPTPQLQQVVKQTQNQTVVYMDYAQHKTFGLLKKTLPSDSNRSLMPQKTLEDNFAAMQAVSAYTKITNGEVQRKDLVVAHGAGYGIDLITLSHGQRDVASLVNEEAAEILQLNRKELDRLTFTGLMIQMGPEYIEEDRLKELLNKYSSGMITHGRLTSMLEEMETFLKPETVLAFSRKLTELATNYWRFEMAQEDGGLENYFLNHDSVTEYLRREPGKERLSTLWAEFPARMISDMFLNIPVNLPEGEQKHTLGFHIGYIRVPYFAAELPIGVNSDDSKGFGIVVRNVTPGLYNLCKTLYEAYPGALHRVIMTNEGRMVNVTRSMIEGNDCYYIQELKDIL